MYLVLIDQHRSYLGKQHPGPLLDNAIRQNAPENCFRYEMPELATRQHLQFGTHLSRKKRL
jgi:hypothetical protein